MGSITNKFICVEINTVEPHEYVYLVYCYNRIGASVFVGADSTVFVTIPPSGSKDGWQCSEEHNELANNLVQALESTTRSNNDFLIVKSVITSQG
jgi:hypothetical protein